MNNKFKVTIFGILLIMLMSVAVAAEVSDDTTTVDTIAEEVEPVATEVTSPQTDNILEENDIETDMVYSGDNPQTISTLENETTYENAEITLNNDVTYSDAQVTFGNNVTLTANGKTLTNVKININGTNVTITNVNFNHNTTTDTKVINIDHASNVTINNVNINLYKSDYSETKAISITNSSCVKVNSSNIDVSTLSQSLVWKTNDNWVTYWSELNVAAVVIDQSTGVCFTNNNVNIYNNNINLNDTTMPGIIVRYGTSNSCIKNNNINVTGSHYNYGIMCSDYVSNLSIRDNDIRVTGEKNVVGIDASTSTGSVVYNNTIYANSTNTLGLAPTEQSLAYGILTNTYYNGNANNYVAYNTINLTGTVCYGIENYMGNNNTFNHNTVTATGTTAMGLGSWGSTNCKIINNNFTIAGDGTVENTFYEQISPQNVGIIITGNQTYLSSNNIIIGNTIELTAPVMYTINLTINSSSNIVANNSLSNYLGLEGNETVLDEGSNNVTSNDERVEYVFDDSEIVVCPCTCCNTVTTTNLQNSINTVYIKKKILISKKTDEQAPSIITLTTENFSTYVTDGRFNEKVNEGDVIDFNGLFDGTKYSLTIDKPLNLTSLNNNAYLIFHSNANGGGNGFNIIKGGSGSNVTNIIFHNTHVRTEEAANITFNNISLTCDRGIGYGVGAISIRSSDNVNITNSYFKSKDNAGHSTVVYATSNNCLFENNTVLGEGNVGNLFYITTYGGSGFSYNITIRNNYIDNTQAYNQSICQAMVISGAGHLIENNTIVANEWALGIQYYDPEFGEEGNPGEGTSIVKDNLILQGMMSKNENIIYENNIIYPAKTLVINDDNFDKYLFISKQTSTTTSIDINFTSLELNTPYNIVYNATKDVVFQFARLQSPSNYYIFENGDGVRIIAGNEHLTGCYFLAGTNLTGLYIQGGRVIDKDTNPIYDSIISEPSIATNNLINTFIIKDNRLVYNGTRKNANDENSAIYQIVTNENYMNYFDEETGIIKDDLSSYNFIIDGEIYKSLIFNKVVNLRGFNFALGYTLIKNSTLNNVKFIEGSENSNISWLKINNLTIHDTSNINIANNTIDGLLILNNSQSCKIISNDMDVFGRQITHPDSNIILYDSVNNFIEGNIIRTSGRFAISLDNLSYENLIQDNNLISGFYSRYYETPLFNYYGKDCIENNGTNTLFNNNINPKYNLKLNTKTFAVNQENTLNVNVNCEEFTVTNGKVIFSLNGTYLGEANVENGVASLTFTPTALGSSSLSAWYVSDELDMPKGLTETATVKDFIGTNVLIDYSGKVNSESFVTFTVTDEDGNPMNEGQLTYSFNNGEEKTITLTENTVTIPLEDTEHIAGKEVKVTYTPADSKYSSQTNTTTLDLEKANTQFTAVYDVIDDNNGNLTITLTDEFGNPLKEYKFNLVVDGVKTLETTDNNGVKVVSINSDKKEIEITATYLGNGAFINSTLTKTVKLVKDPTTITVTSNKPTVSETLEINGTLKDEEKAISNAEVILSVNDENITLTTDENGEFTYSIEQPDKGSYTIIATFKGDENYKESTAKTKTYVKDPENVDVDDVLNQLEELKEQNQKQVEELQKNNEELQEQLNNLTQLNEELKEQLEQLQEQNNKTSEQLDNITQANNELKEQLANQTANLTEQNKDLQGQLDNLTKDNEDLSEQLNDTKNNLTQQNNDLQEQLNNLTQQNKELQEQLKALEEQNNVTSEQNKELNDKLDSLVDLINQLNAPKDTVLTLDELDDAKYGDSITITGSLVDVGGNGVAGTVKLTINGGRATVVSDAGGTFAYDYVVTHVGDNEVVATYAGTDRYNPSNTSMTFSVGQQDTMIVFDELADIISGQKASITGQLVDANGNGIYGTVKLTVNNGRATVKTDKDGYFSYNATLSKVGVNNITGSYLESAKYLASNATTIVNVNAIETSIIVDEILPVKSGDKVTITGKLVDANANPVVGTIKLLINNGRATVKTDNNGVFTYEYTLTKVGTNNITLSYLGANRYTPSNTVTTVVVSALNTKLTIDPVTAKKGETITLSGKLVDEKDNPVVGTVKLLINGGRATVKTDSEGVFTYDYTVSKVGINNITATYLGANRYTQTAISSTIEVVKAATTITLNPINTVTQKTSVDITGQLNDEFGNGIYGTVKLLINGGRATVKTDKAGAFTYSYNATRAGENTITANYLESNNYEATESTTTFTVVKA